MPYHFVIICPLKNLIDFRFSDENYRLDTVSLNFEGFLYNRKPNDRCIEASTISLEAKSIPTRKGLTNSHIFHVMKFSFFTGPQKKKA